MKIIQNKKQILKYTVLICLLTIISYQGISGIVDPKSFDNFSNNLMITNIAHDQNEGERTILLQTAQPKDFEYVSSSFLNEEDINYSEYTDYISQIGVHGIIQNFVFDISPLSHTSTLRVIYFANALLFAIVLLTICVQLDKLLNTKLYLILLVILCLFAPDLMKYGRNLYWNGWIQFLPFAVSLWTVNSKIMQHKRRNVYLFFITFATCLSKLLCNYEFVSAVMIATMIPFIFFAIKDETLSWVGKMKLLVVPACGALLSFPMALGVQFVQNYVIYHDFTVTWSHFKEVILVRIFGDKNSSLEALKDAANASKISVISSYFQTEMFNFYGVKLLYRDIIVIILGFSVYGLWFKKNAKCANIRLNIDTLSIVTLVSILAPLSWLFLASPHAYIHRTQCVMLWFLPFLFLGITLTLYVIKISFLDKLFEKNKEI